MKKNEVIFKEKALEISVNESASPLFYNFPKGEQLKEIQVSGKVTIENKILANKDDSYLQVGLIYNGDYRPNSFALYFLPDWLKVLIKNANNRGLGKVSFYGIALEPNEVKRVQQIRDIELEFMPDIKMSEKGEFVLSIEPEKPEAVIGLWIRCDGDDSKAKFTTVINAIKITSSNSPSK